MKPICSISVLPEASGVAFAPACCGRPWTPRARPVPQRYCWKCAPPTIRRWPCIAISVSGNACAATIRQTAGREDAWSHACAGAGTGMSLSRKEIPRRNGVVSGVGAARILAVARREVENGHQGCCRGRGRTPGCHDAQNPAALIEKPAKPADRPVSVDGMEWDELRQCIVDRRACGSRAATGGSGVGDENADWLFIGEGPGAEEDAREPSPAVRASYSMPCWCPSA